MEHLGREELLALLRTARKCRERDWVLFLVSFWHGLRASEALGLTPANFSVTATEIFLEVQRLKGSMRTVQPLMEDPDELLDEKTAVRLWLARHHELHGDRAQQQRLFPITRQQFYNLTRKYGLLAGLPAHLCHPHVLKHSIAMQSIRQLGIENLKQWLGHRSIASTGAYLRVDDQAAAHAMRQAFPAARVDKMTN
jgi:integrase